MIITFIYIIKYFIMKNTNINWVAGLGLYQILHTIYRKYFIKMLLFG